jgi:hypothetical protein
MRITIEALPFVVRRCDEFVPPRPRSRHSTHIVASDCTIVVEFGCQMEKLQ